MAAAGFFQPTNDIEQRRLPRAVRPHVAQDLALPHLEVEVVEGRAARFAAENITEDELDELREIQDWLIAPQLKTVQGVTEINSFGGFVKQYEVIVTPGQLRALSPSSGAFARPVFGFNSGSTPSRGTGDHAYLF